ncbi:acyl--CoA ligase [Neorhizobium sp. T786]|uniref:class I adenylate-forming enzyme family protein n=1 Tax=Pseudorhizobium xiangyangii TaxID=2883104 RepID=UPI001CFFE7DF|nr:class I adenylate-forming enzyme family protein [Neorhizobium xiangyangii]MCB5201418.1 acyl--CoA ligase [Neorhizobium xiangyangii]
MRIETRLRNSADRFGGKTAIIAGSCRLTYAELDTQSDRLASALSCLGVTQGARVVLLLDNDAEAVTSFFAIWKARAVACPLHPSMKPQKLAAIIASTDAAAVIVSARLLANVDIAISLAGLLPVRIVTHMPPGTAHTALRFEDLVEQGAASELPSLDDCEALALLIHTSGSTGRPKGVKLTHANVDAACQSIITYLENTPDDIVLSVLPLSFGYGITQAVTMTSVGGTLVLEKSFAFPRKIVDRLRDERATGFPLVPAMAALLGNMQDLAPGSLPDLRYVTSAAAALPPTIARRMQDLMPRARIVVMYGQTECLRISYLPAEELVKRPTSVGKAIPGTHALIVDDDGAPVGPDVIGELTVEGPHVMAGYWQDELGTVQTLEPTANGRRLRTGDLFRMDADGFLYFISRKDDIIKTRGEKVSPQEVERVLYALPGIKEAAVAGIDDPVFGQVVRAYVVLESDVVLSERDIIRHCASHLEDYMVPKSVEFRDALPKTTTGKIRMTAAIDQEPQWGPEWGNAV